MVETELTAAVGPVRVGAAVVAQAALAAAAAACQDVMTPVSWAAVKGAAGVPGARSMVTPRVPQHSAGTAMAPAGARASVPQAKVVLPMPEPVTVTRVPQGRLSAVMIRLISATAVAKV